MQTDVAQIGQQTEELQDLVGYLEAAGGCDIDGPARQNSRYPQQFAVGGGHGLHRATVPLVLSGIPVLFLGVLGGDAFGGDVDSVDDEVVPAGFHRQSHDSVSGSARRARTLMPSWTRVRQVLFGTP